MDPVLSSTVDFEEYIKGNLSLTGQKASLSSAKPASHRQLTTKGRAKVNSDEYNSEDLSHSLLQLNLKKYDKSGPPQRSAHTPRGSSFTDLPSPPKPAVTLQHSWRAHLKPDSSSSSKIVHAAKCVDYTSEGIACSMSSTTPRNELRSPGKHKISSARVHLRSSQGAESKSLDTDEFGFYRVRMVTLKRLFGDWSAFCRSSRRQLALASRDVLENAIYWPKQAAFTWWKCLYKATVFQKVIVQYL